MERLEGCESLLLHKILGLMSLDSNRSGRFVDQIWWSHSLISTAMMVRIITNEIKGFRPVPTFWYRVQFYDLMEMPRDIQLLEQFLLTGTMT